MTVATTAKKKKKRKKISGKRGSKTVERIFYKHCISVYLSDEQLDRLGEVITLSKKPKSQGSVLRDSFERIYCQ
jgi:hypothetical protein